MNKSPNRSLIDECDRLIQAIACLDWCMATGYPAEVGHHLITKSQSKYFQHNLRNIVPLLNSEHTGDSESCAHKRPNDFENMLAMRCPEQYRWWQKHKNEIHKAPNREQLLETRDYLRAFLAAGKPYVWNEGEG